MINNENEHVHSEWTHMFIKLSLHTHKKQPQKNKEVVVHPNLKL